MPTYCSFFVFEPDEIDMVLSLCAGTGWKASEIEDPSQKYKFSEDGVITTTATVEALDEFGSLRNDEAYGRLLLLDGNENDTNNVIQLISDSCTILKAYSDQKSPPSFGFPIEGNQADREKTFNLIFKTKWYFDNFFYWMELPVAVAMAARAWSDKKAIYAIHKLALSYRTESVTPHSMDPYYGQVFLKHTEDHASHVGTSTAINLAYSAIQELGLDIKSSASKPRWIDNKKFLWNPVVLNDIETRLEKSGLSRDRKVDWIVRGEQSEVEVHPVRDTLSSFADGRMVRDREISIPDAINACEYLRNYMTAHAFSSSTPLLGPYEVFNAQNVARLLILAKCDLLNTWTKDLKP